ncbi:hypothetical protein CEUSTIGMA_g10368.t1 [Chlamydomonas eustigma]|uniref:Uncharacterized protein n=1 Tax=Chlamydomonas eustigma TaxID=1157962 RepID=A0A250XIM7_9CHLO|nr:hypothetical protein CEUSTIGMA_g10368.t1 [Chlamydomonas eustigma]|eukprot:GAX82941.1 hypothetical protein CEUSTIGMA_g10368.t1 [Chlamydomonas eustigma]
MKQKKELLSRLRNTRMILIQKLLAEQKNQKKPIPEKPEEANTISRGVSFPPSQQLSSYSHPAANSTQDGLSCTRPKTPLRLLAVKTGDKEGDEESSGWHADLCLRHNTTFQHEDDHRGHTHSSMYDFVHTSRATSCDLIQPDACTADVRHVRHDMVVFSAVKEVHCLEDRTAAHQQEVHCLEDRTAAHQQEVHCLEDRTAAHQQEVHCLEDRTAAHQQELNCLEDRTAARQQHDDIDTMNHVALEISSPEESAEVQTRRTSQQAETEQNNAVDSTAAAITNKEGGCCALSGAEKPGEAFQPSATPRCTSNASSSLSISHGMYLSFLSGHHGELEVVLCCDAASLNELESSLHVLHDVIKEIQQRRAFKRLHSNMVDLLPDMDHLATLHLYSTGSEQHAPLSGTRVPEVSCQRQQRLAQSLHFVLTHLPSQLIVAVTYEACSVQKRGVEEGAARAASSPRIAKSDALQTSLAAPGRSKLLLYGVGMVNIHEMICDNGDTVPNEPFPLHDIMSIRPNDSRVRILSLPSLANNLLARHLNQQTTEDHEEKVGEEDQALQLGQASVTRRYSQLDNHRCCNDHPSSCGDPVASTGHPLMPQATVKSKGENAKLPNVQPPMTETAALVGGKRKHCQQNQSNSSKHQSCSLYDIPPPAALRQRSPLTKQCTRELIGRLGFGFKSNWKTDVKIVVGGRCVPHVVSVATNPSKVVGVQDQQKLTALERSSSSPATEIIDTAGVPDVATASCTATATVIRSNTRLVTSGGGLTASNAAQVFTGSASMCGLTASNAAQVFTEAAHKTEKGDEGSETQTQTQHPPLSLKDGDVYELPAGIRSLCSFEQWCKYSGLVMLKELQRKRVLSVKQRLHIRELERKEASLC